MDKFTEEDISQLIFDLELYSGNIWEVSNIGGPSDYTDSINGEIHTVMDIFNFMASPHRCSDDEWVIELADPVESIRSGNRSLVPFAFPKIHKNPELIERYRVANLLYDRYNKYSNVEESKRNKEYEALLGYAELPTYIAVSNAIISDYRSHQEKKDEEFKRKIQRN